ncbi:MAG: hypothetical protein NVS1B3_07080 [Candidatus Dormibacteraceae bacterium]
MLDLSRSVVRVHRNDAGAGSLRAHVRDHPVEGAGCVHADPISRLDAEFVESACDLLRLAPQLVPCELTISRPQNNFGAPRQKRNSKDP